MEFDYIYRNIGILEAVEVLTKVTNGLKVAVHIDINFYKEEEYAYSRMLPKQVDEFFKLKDQMKWVNLLREIAPHTIIPQRMLTIRKSKSVAKSLVSSYNLVYGDSEDQRIFFYNLESIPAYKPLSSKEYSYGILALEYRFNLNRFIIECLKIAEKMGAKIITENCNENFASNEQLGSNLHAEDEYIGTNQHISLTNVVRFCDKQNDILAIPSGNKLKINSVGTKNSEITTLVNDRLEVDISEKNRVCEVGTVDALLAQMKVKFTEEELKSTNSKINNQNNTTSRLLNTQELTTLCDSKYDMYKETGISKDETKKLFFTYGEAVDDIAETVYSLINKEKYKGNRKLLWTDAETIYLKKEEWN